MESSLTNTYCSSCKTFKTLSKFMGYGEINNNQPNILEVIDINFLSETITSLLEDILSNNQELYLHCQVNDISYKNSINEHLSKELTNKIIELIEDADGYNWNYNHLYTIELFHKDLHVRPIDKSVSQDVKEFIKDNIDFLSKEIYVHLIDKGLNEVEPVHVLAFKTSVGT
ncbi:hypothetical protein C1645_837063 [Glomus cerebriforme]|uniref:Uncharacterized protein n=1 Tax=Glomus cerebriforme TaxID=658196 RepID=A0A397SF76_9GLOM|nr:hypothetical protein C1645_837063 [Glomus cerebriforme]